MTTPNNVRNHATVVGVFNDIRMAQAAVEELRRVGFREDQSASCPATTGRTPPGKPRRPHGGGRLASEEGAAVGAAAGAGIGALWAVGMATIALPPILPAVLVSNWLVSVLASAVSGAVIAGIAGALIGLGIPEEEATYYEGEFKSGRTLVTVQAPGRYEEVRDILRRYGAYDHANREVDRESVVNRNVNVPVAREDVIERRPVSNTPDVRVPVVDEDEVNARNR